MPLPRITSLKFDATWLAIFAVIMRVWYLQIKSQYEVSAHLSFNQHNISSIENEVNLQKLYETYKFGLHCESNKNFEKELSFDIKSHLLAKNELEDLRNSHKHNDLKGFCNSAVDVNSFSDLSTGFSRTTTGLCRVRHDDYSHYNYDPCKCFVPYLKPKAAQKCTINNMIYGNCSFLAVPSYLTIVVLILHYIKNVFKNFSNYEDSSPFKPLHWAVMAVFVSFYSFGVMPREGVNTQCGYLGESVLWLTAMCNWNNKDSAEVLEKANIGKMPGGLESVYKFLEAGRDTLNNSKFALTYHIMGFTLAAVLALRGLYGVFSEGDSLRQGGDEYDEIPGSTDSNRSSTGSGAKVGVEARPVIEEIDGVLDHKF